MQTAITKYYKLSKLLNDDLYLIAHALKNISKQELCFSKVLKHLEALKLDEYDSLLDECLLLDTKELIEASRGLEFSSESQYIIYLQGLLNIEGIVFAGYVKKSNSQGVLF